MVVAASLIAACSDEPAFMTGTVVGRRHRSAATVIVPVSCGQSCFTMIPIYHPERWSLTLENCDFRKKSGECKREQFDVPSVAWAQARIGTFYNADTGEVR